MYDLSQPNTTPGQCNKCRGTGIYSWGAVVNGVPSKSGPCHSCRGKGHQTASDIAKNTVYNVHKVNAIMSADLR